MEARWPWEDDESLVVLFHPWTRIRRLSPAVDLHSEPDGIAVSFMSPTPLASEGTSVSLVVWLSESLGGASLALGDEPIELMRTSFRRGASRRYVSVRFRVPEEPLIMRLVPRRPDPKGRVEVRVHRWKRDSAAGRVRIAPGR